MEAMKQKNQLQQNPKQNQRRRGDFIYVIIILFCCSCNNVIIYYNDKGIYDDAEIWGTTDLYLFFLKEESINVEKVNSKRIQKELNRIKKEVLHTGERISWDNYSYQYAFINRGDTIYANINQDIWRYGKQQARIKSTMVYLMEVEQIHPYYKK